MRQKKKKKTSSFDVYIKANKKINREIELERNGGRWIAIDRPHRNKKKYYRKNKHKMGILDDPHYLYHQNINVQI